MRGQSIHWSALFCNFINTRAYQLGWFKPSSPSTKGLHGCKNNRSFFYYIVWVAGAGTILFVNVDVASNTNVGHIGIGDANVGRVFLLDLVLVLALVYGLLLMLLSSLSLFWCCHLWTVSCCCCCCCRRRCCWWCCCCGRCCCFVEQQDGEQKGIHEAVSDQTDQRRQSVQRFLVYFNSWQ